jgi:hypothetical protein
MIEATLTAPARASAPTETPAADPARAETGMSNPAVARCCAAMLRAYKKERANGATGFMSSVAGSKAFRESMPVLDGQDNIRDFIACAAHGVLIGTIDTKRGNRLLYAAQVALSALRRKLKKAENKKTPPTQGVNIYFRPQNLPINAAS